MSLYTISDLHLPLGIDKPMDIFGGKWDNYVEKIKENWKSKITDGDVVVLGGDFSWATYLNEAYRDFEYLNDLPGRKILLKGNHDYWWTTLNKLKEFLTSNEFFNIDILQNNSFKYEDIGICGTRGWMYYKTPNAENEKLYNRELLRLELSIKDAMKKNVSEIYLFTHYPPVIYENETTPFHEILKKYPVSKCIYGHLHGNSFAGAFTGKKDGIEYILASGDYINFDPIRLCL